MGGFFQTYFRLKRNCFEVQIIADQTEWIDKLMKDLTEK